MRKEMTMRKASFSLVVVVAAAILAAVAARASDDRKPRVIHIQEHVTNATYVPVYTLVGGSGPSSQGDYIAFDDPDFDPNTGQQVGHNIGVCVLVDASTQIYSCPPVTFFLAGRGQIAVGGEFDGTGNPTTGPILYGTGEFQGASGTVRVQALNGTVNDFVFTLWR